MLLASLVLLLSLPSTYEPVRLADGVYSFQSRDPSRGNTGCVMFKNFVLAIDAGNAKDAIAEIHKLTEKPIRFLFNSSSSHDHCAENQAYLELGATIVAQELCLREQSPVIRFATRLDLDDGTQRVELLHFGAGNGAGDSVAFLPRCKTLFAGDLCAPGAMSEASDSSSWLDVLDHLRELDIEHVVPGRGAAGTSDLLENQRRWLTELEAQIGAQMTTISGTDLSSIELDMAWFRTWTGSDPEAQTADIASVFAELTGRTPPWRMLRELELVPATRRRAKTAKTSVVVPSEPDLLDLLTRFARTEPGLELRPARDAQEAARLCTDADAVIGFCSADIVRAGTKLRWIQVGSAGVENYLTIPELKQKDELEVTNAQRLYGPEIAEHAMAMVLALTRGLRNSIPAQAQGTWQRQPAGGAELIELRGKTALVLGLGGIGTEVARRAHAFDLEVLATRRKVKDPPSFVLHVGTPEESKALAARADIVFNCLPLTPATEKICNATLFAAMRKTAYFVNVGRGKTVDTAALVQALKSGGIAGAALDVTDPEPLPPNHELWRMPNVVITPHNSAHSDRAEARRSLLYRENLRRFVQGEPLLSVVDKASGY